MAEIKKDRYYVESHEWILFEDDIAYIGISDYAQEELGDIVYVESEGEDEEFEKGEIFGSVESVKMASDLYMPVDGIILEFNEKLTDEPELINEDPYENWIIKIKATNLAQQNDLLDVKEYQAIIDEE
ncbi:MAG: glycine cleavage system protein GcvH [Clostridiaceae bacterium]|nr:glycine cleavage system protein GcvH [Clostridiaceae bacterium]